MCVTADGTSDDIDQPIRKLFADVDFVKKYNLCSANSLNWARIMIQTAHFYFAYLKVSELQLKGTRSKEESWT